MSEFVFRGVTYEVVQKPMIGELAYVERQAGASGSDMHTAERVMSGYLISIRRGQLAMNQPLMTWAEIGRCTMDEFDDVPEPGDDPEPIEQGAPVDPTDATAPPAVAKPERARAPRSKLS